MAALTLYEKLDQIESRYDEMTHELSSPEVLTDSARYQKLAKMHSEMGEIVANYREWKEIEKGLEGAKQLFGTFQALLDFLPFAILRHDLAHFRVHFGELLITRRICEHLGRGELARHFVIARFNLIKFFVQRQCRHGSTSNNRKIETRNYLWASLPKERRGSANGMKRTSRSLEAL